MQIICTSFQTDNHASTSSLIFTSVEAFNAKTSNTVVHGKQDSAYLMYKMWLEADMQTVRSAGT